MTNELLQQVRLIDPVSGTDQLADVLIADGVIKVVQERISNYPTDTHLRDCRGTGSGTRTSGFVQPLWRAGF